MEDIFDEARAHRLSHVAILLVPGFAMISYACAVEPLRAANTFAGRRLYSWVHVSPNGQQVDASNGARVAVDCGPRDLEGIDLVLVCAGGNPARFKDRTTFSWLRGLARRGAIIGGISGGPYILANAGLLDGHSATVHWEHAAAFAEAFPKVRLRPSLYQIDEARLTCSGGVAALDLMHEVIGETHGYNLARKVSDWFLQSHVRPGSEGQRLGPRERLGVRSRRLEAVIGWMERHLEQPMSRDALASTAGISTRQLDRLFRAHLGTSTERFYLHLRLERAHELLRQTCLSASEIAVATGFGSASHFSRTYRKHFGVSPREDMQRLGFAEK